MEALRKMCRCADDTMISLAESNREALRQHIAGLQRKVTNLDDYLTAQDVLKRLRRQEFQRYMWSIDKDHPDCARDFMHKCESLANKEDVWNLWDYWGTSKEEFNYDCSVEEKRGDVFDFPHRAFVELGLSVPEIPQNMVFSDEDFPALHDNIREMHIGKSVPVPTVDEWRLKARFDVSRWKHYCLTGSF